jgi:hypothetical protein
LFDSLALASDKDLVLARLFFLASRRKVTSRHAWVTAYSELFPTCLLARLFTLAGTMALLLTLVSATPKSFSTNVSATDIRKPAWLVLQHVLATQTGLSSQKWAFRAAFFVSVAVVTHLRMTTVFGTLAREAAWGRLRTAG